MSHIESLTSNEIEARWDIGWYALKVRARSEAVAAAALLNRGYQSFAPSYRERRKYSDRIKIVELAAFPGYIFARFGSQDKVPVLTSPGVASVVRCAGIPTPIEDNEIAAIRRLLAGGAQPIPYLRCGQRVRIEYGVFAGTEGVLTRIDNRSFLTLSVEVLHRSIAVSIDENQVWGLESRLALAATGGFRQRG
jgi:transcription antitermination factor NusG